jgi:hypothetical protein
VDSAAVIFSFKYPTNALTAGRVIFTLGTMSFTQYDATGKSANTGTNTPVRSSSSTNVRDRIATPKPIRAASRIIRPSLD